MQLLIHGQVLTKLIANVLVLSFLEMTGLPSVENLAQNVWLIAVPLEGYRFPQPSRDHLAEELVFHSVVEEDGAAFDVE